MKKVIYFSCAILMTITGCKKEVAVMPMPPGETLPFENDDIRMELVSTSVPYYTRDIHFFNSSTGILVTYDGEIYKTTNGGLTWTLKYSNPGNDQPLFDVYFSDANTGYAVGGSTSCGGTGCIPPGGIIVKTTDGGDSWTSILQTPDVEYVSVTANSVGDIFAISRGTNGVIIKSTNAGDSWTISDTTSFRLGKITFNGSTGFCTGMEGNIERSSDDGETWDLSTTFPAYYTTDIKFNNGLGYCLVNSKSVFKTTDNGDTWSESFYSDHSSFVLEPLTTNSCLVFGAGPYTGGCFGTHYGKLRQTKDGGITWAETHFSETEEIRYSSFFSSTNGYAVAGSKLIRVTVK